MACDVKFLNIFFVLFTLWERNFVRLKNRKILLINFRKWPTKGHFAKNKLSQSRKKVYFAWNKLSRLVKFFLKKCLILK